MSLECEIGNLETILTREQVDAFVASLLPDFHFWEMTEDTGVAGFCDEVSEGFIKFLGRGHLHWFYAGQLPKIYWDSASHMMPSELLGSDHCVVVLDGWFVDWTPRQFRDELPVPLIWRWRRDGKK